LEGSNPHMCFACSPHNPIGLHLQFVMDGELCRSNFVAREEHQGWNGFVHGGLIATLLDEVMAQWLWLQGVSAMTAETTIRFSLPVPINVPLTLESSKTGGKGRLFELAGRLILPGGQLAARARAKFLEIAPTEST